MNRELISYADAARQLAETSLVSFSEAYETLLTASDAIRAAERRAAEQAWDEGWAAGQADEFDAREGREHDDTVNPYRTADPAEQPKTGPVAANSPQDEPERSPNPAERHTADSPKARGGWVGTQSDTCPLHIEWLRHLEPGLSVASINGAAIADWLYQTADLIDQPATRDTEDA